MRVSEISLNPLKVKVLSDSAPGVSSRVGSMSLQRPPSPERHSRFFRALQDFQTPRLSQGDPGMGKKPDVRFSSAENG